MAYLNWNTCPHSCWHWRTHRLLYLGISSPVWRLAMDEGQRRAELQRCLGASAGAQMWQPDLWVSVSQSKVPLYAVCWPRLGWKCNHNPAGFCAWFKYGSRRFLLLDGGEPAEGFYIAPIQLLRRGKLIQIQFITCARVIFQPTDRQEICVLSHLSALHTRTKRNEVEVEMTSL